MDRLRGLDGQVRDRLRQHRQMHRHTTALPRPRAVGHDPAAVELDQPPRQREADTEATLGPVARAFALHEQVEGALQQLRGHADAAVEHLDHDLSLDSLHRHMHAPAGRRVLERVADQVADDLLDARGVAVDHQRLDDTGHVVGGELAGLTQHGDMGADRLADVQRLPLEVDLSGDHATDLQQVVDDAREVAGLPGDHGASAGRHRLGCRALEEPRRRRQGAERVAQLVTQHRQELVLGPVRLLRLREQIGPLALDSLALGDVAGDLQDADDAPQRVLDRRDRQRDRHPRAVLAHPLGVEVFDRLAAAQAGHHLGGLRGVVLGDDQRDRLADRLRRRVAEDPLGGPVPGGDDTVERLADDRVLRGLDQRHQPRP